MFSRKLKCEVLEKRWLTPTVMQIRFSASRSFTFSAGQFISVNVPGQGKKEWRCYSLASSPEEASANRYELCIKCVPNGKGSSYMEQLQPGDTFTAKGPFGVYTYHPPQPGRNAVFIASGTGIAPIRSMLLSKEFQEHRPENSVLLMGAQNEEEILYRNEFRALGVETVHALSKPNFNWLGFEGRVTDVLHQLPKDWNWHNTDFYVSGSGEMVRDVLRILVGGHGIRLQNIHFEAFTIPGKGKRKTDRSQLPANLIKAAA